MSMKEKGKKICSFILSLKKADRNNLIHSENYFKAILKCDLQRKMKHLLQCLSLDLNLPQ